MGPASNQRAVARAPLRHSEGPLERCIHRPAPRARRPSSVIQLASFVEDAENLKLAASSRPSTVASTEIVDYNRTSEVQRTQARYFIVDVESLQSIRKYEYGPVPYSVSEISTCWYSLYGS